MAMMDSWRPRRGMSTRSGATSSPYGELMRMQRELQEVAEALFGGMALGSSSPADVFVPALDMMDCGNEVVLRADLPGLEKDEIQIEVQDGELTLRGERKDDHEEHGDDYHRVERWEGSFMRTIPIPAGVDADQISAQMNNGVLEVHMPKSAESAARKIEVKGEAGQAGRPGQPPAPSNPTQQKAPPISGTPKQK
jgi:HSP20 family protein